MLRIDNRFKRATAYPLQLNNSINQPDAMNCSIKYKAKKTIEPIELSKRKKLYIALSPFFVERWRTAL